MIVLVDGRPMVAEGYKALFAKQGFAVEALCPSEAELWRCFVGDEQASSVEAFLIGSWDKCESFIAELRSQCTIPIIALIEHRSLADTLDLFAAGADDVIRKPVHVREILARIQAIHRRKEITPRPKTSPDIEVYFDGSDPVVGGKVLELPRRERRILEYLLSNKRRVTKSQIFNAVYGMLNEDVDENVIESHICKLRKKLRHCLGFDPIDSKRYLGYQLCLPARNSNDGAEVVKPERVGELASAA
ncbi:MAG: response regulator transcription factor [Hyphomicrobiales bacterium]|nr:response regulator transcription factor [Hyphomicrobiales bacterium]